MMKKLFVFILIGLSFASISYANLSGGSGTINQLELWKSTTTPFSGITTNTHGRNIYTPYSTATTSRMYSNAFCINNASPECISSWSSILSGGTAGMLTSWLTGTSLTATSAPTASYYTATSTTATSTFAGDLQVTGTKHLYTHGIQANDSQGIHLHSNNGTEVGYLGAGGGSGATWAGTQLFSGVATDITTGTNENFVIIPNGTGNVGIGSTTPGSLLSIGGNGTGINFLDGVNATSTISGSLHIKTNLQVDGGYFALVNLVSSGNATINGSLTVTGQTTLATSLTGLLKGASGVVSAITTSLGLAGEISDETGSGALVFGTSPAFTTNISTPSIITASGALGITPASGSNLNVNLATTGDFAVNTSQLYVDTSAGNVGIGTVSPQSNFDLSMNKQKISSSPDVYAYLGKTNENSNYAALQLSQAGGASASDRYWSFQTIEQAVANAGSLVFQPSGGNVGIGTTNPSLAKLQLADTNKVTNSSGNALIYTTDSQAIDLGGQLDLGGVYTGTSITGFGSMAGRKENSTDANLAGYLQFGTTLSGGSITEKMRITSSGNVGIGTTTPFAKLSVTGSGTGTGSAFQVADSANSPKFTVLDNGNVGIGTTAPATSLQIGSAPDGVTAGAGGLSVRATDGRGIIFETGSAAATTETLAIGHLSNTATTPVLNVYGGNGSTDAFSASRFVVLSGGNVGIGTTSPWRTLSVTGTVGFDGLTGSTGAGSLCLDSNKQVVYNSASDACLSSTRATKHDIQTLNLDGLSLINSLQPSSFIYNQGDGRTRYGFMAEDTALVDDRLATHNEKGEITGIDDRAILSVVVKAMKEVGIKLQKLVARISGLEQRVNQQEKRIDELEKIIQNIYGH